MTLRIAIVIVFDLKGFSKQKHDKQKEIANELENTINTSIESINHRFEFKHTGDGYLIVIPDKEIPLFGEFINSLMVGLRPLEVNYQQCYRIGADIGIFDDNFNSLTGSHEHFSECGIQAARLEESGKQLSGKNESIVLVSERLAMLFNNQDLLLFEDREHVACKDRSLFAYRISIKNKQLDQDNFLRDFIFENHSNHIMSNIKNKHYNILVLDDEQDNRKILEFYLKDFSNDNDIHLNVFVACNGEKGLEIFNKHKIDLVLLDIMMPGYSGREIAKHIRNLYQNIIICFQSALGRTDDVMKGFRYGVEYYLTKPFEENELLFTVASLLSFREAFYDDYSWVWKFSQKYKFSIVETLMEIRKDNSRVLSAKNSYISNFLRHNIKNLVEKNVPKVSRQISANRIKNLSRQVKKISALAFVFAFNISDVCKFLKERIAELIKLDENLDIVFKCDFDRPHKDRFSHISSLLCLISYELLDNAVKYTGSIGLIEVTMFIMSIEPYIVIVVKNEGKEINENTTSKMFEKGFSSSGGTGLGLYLTKIILEQNSGTINYKYSKNKNNFIVKIPLN